jgi:radical SAM protein with 4Fe4S-binding SPASM domain
MTIKYNGDVIPCCTFRHIDQYRQNAKSRSLGNVFSDGVRNIWNSSDYRMLRHMASNPHDEEKKTNFLNLFCDRCPALFNTNASSYHLMGDKYKWEDIYQFDDRKRVCRKNTD